MSAEQDLSDEITVILLQKAGRLPPDIYVGEIDMGDTGLGFAHKKLRKRLKKQLKKRFRSLKRLIKNPGKEIKREAKRVVKNVKKIGPYVIAGVATYYGGAAGAAFGKKLVQKQLTKRAKLKAKNRYRRELKAAGVSDFRVPSVSDIESPNGYAKDLMTQSLATKGVVLKSRAANDAISGYVDKKLDETSSGFDIKKLIIPLTVGASILMLAKS